MTIEHAIQRAIAEAQGRPITWGRDDCCLWVAGIVRDLTGADPAAAWRGAYDSMGRARRKLGRPGVPAAIDAVAAREGWQPVPLAAARTGDIGVIVNRAHPFGGAAVIRLNGWWVGREPDGVGFLPAVAVDKAWRPPFPL